jgi:hypothetical protein
MNGGTSTVTPLAPSRCAAARRSPGDGDSLSGGLRIVRADDRADAVLQRRDDPAAVGVILRIGAEDQADVQIQPDRIAANLHVALLQHVEQSHLNARRQIRQLVDGENPAIAARDQPVVHRRFIRQVSALGMFHQIDLADQIGDGHIRRGQLFVVAVVAMHPFDLGVSPCSAIIRLPVAVRGRSDHR